MKGQNIGRAAGILVKQAREHDLDWEYGRAMGAPMDELGGIIHRGYARDARITWRRIKALTGLKPKPFMEELTRRTSPRWVHFHMPETFIGGIKRF